MALSICVLMAALEGLCAGKNVKSFYAELHFPRYSGPLWVWSIIGGVYYVIFEFILYRLLTRVHSTLWFSAFALILVMMIVNALTNYVIFRARNIGLSFFVPCVFPFMDVALFGCLLWLDKHAAWSLIPYLVYRVYSVVGLSLVETQLPVAAWPYQNRELVSVVP
jgi:tryptophan-rich sensory protein